MSQSKCNHPDGKACHKCWPPKPKNPKTAISIFCHISKVKDKYYVAIDGNPHELDEFGISNDQFAEIGDNFEKVVQKALGIKQ
jgi:hypothetical protein